ncbi:MAG: TraB/GumN family protein [Flavobacteriia bacterium]|nr:TraB/GumN family protein [Flavobacteriia bacterium]
MNQTLLFLILFLLEGNLTHHHLSVKKDTENSLLWKIEKEGQKSPSYLFGTMHLIEKEYFYFPKSLEKILKNCSLVITEIDLKNLTSNSFNQNKFLLKDGTLWDFFSENQKKELFLWAKIHLKMKEEIFEKSFSAYKPFVLLQMITQVSFVGKTESYELRLSELVEQYKLNTLGFESIDEQIDIFDQISIEEQVKMLMESVQQFDKQNEELLRLQKNYKNQRLDSLSHIMFNQNNFSSQNEQLFLSARNKKWMPIIEKHLNENKCFIAVGAGHLLGSDGLLQLLKEKGYQLTPVSF